MSLVLIMSKKYDGYSVSLYEGEDGPSASGRAEELAQKYPGLECEVVRGGDIAGSLVAVTGPSEDICRSLERAINGMGAP